MSGRNPSPPPTKYGRAPIQPKAVLRPPAGATTAAGQSRPGHAPPPVRWPGTGSATPTHQSPARGAAVLAKRNFPHTPPHRGGTIQRASSSHTPAPRRGICLDQAGQHPVDADNVAGLHAGMTLYDPARGERYILVSTDPEHALITVQTFSGKVWTYNYAVGIYTMSEPGFYSWLGKEAPPQETHFRWPEELYHGRVARAPTKPKGYQHSYDESSGLAHYDANSREHRKRAPDWIPEERRENFRLRVQDGRLFDADGQPIRNGTVQYAFSQQWGLYGENDVAKGAVHTRYLRGGSVRSAGWILTGPNGEILRVGTDSGHYGPSQLMVFQFLAFLINYGTDLSTVTLHDAAAEIDYNALQIWEWLASGGGQGMPKGTRGKSL